MDEHTTARTAPNEPSPTGAAGFAALGLRTEILEALTALGYEEPTPIQTAAIPPLVEGRDLLGRAATGTGKTAAFALPILQRLPAQRGTNPTAVVLVPTRELAMQVSEAVHRYGRVIGARVLPVYGGQPFGRQLQALRRGVDVVVATPGRALDHIGRGTLVLDDLDVLVLDEADEMLDMGFSEDLDAILAAAPEGHRTVLFSATMPARIDKLARTHLHDPVRLDIDDGPRDAAQDARVRQSAYVVKRPHKAAALARILDVEDPDAAIVFCRTRHEVDELTETLNGRGHRAEGLHGGMSQEQRDKVMGRLRSGTAELLIATDVAARGLDVDTLTHVINFDVPSAPESYVHRIGRVGRAGRDGTAITLAEPRERRLLGNIERLLGHPITVDRLPTVSEVRDRRAEVTASALRELLDEGVPDAEGERLRALVEELVDVHDPVAVAVAAAVLAHRATAGDEADDVEIPDARLGSAGHKDKGDRQQRGKGRGGPERGGAPGPAPGSARIFVGAGRNIGLRPGDLVGAITGESDLTGRDIGAIRIFERHSLVEVPGPRVDEVQWALRRTTLKGRKVSVRRDRDDGGSGPA